MCLALLLALAAPPVHAEPASAAATTWTASLRDEYLEGERIRVPLMVQNSGSEMLTVPDLERRPWLVDFAFDAGTGELEHRRTKAPAADPGQQLKIPPRAQRVTLLEVPTSGTLRAGDYTLLVSILDKADGEPTPVARESMVVAPSHPVSAHLEASAAGADRTQLQSVWVHQAQDAYDLYLHLSDGRRPDRELGSFFLTRLDTKVRPLLSRARGNDAANRHVVWQAGDRAVSVLQLQGLSVRGEVQTVEVPWPRVELVAAPMTDGTGAVHVPLWVPAPRGSGGELRILRVAERGRTDFRRLLRMDAPPIQVESVVDDSGVAHVAVLTAAALDLYSIREVEGGAALPVAGRRLLRPPEGQRLERVEFGLRATEGETAGGLALLALSRSETALTPQWVGLQGGTARSLDPLPLPSSAAVLELVPNGLQAPGVLLDDGGTVRFVEGARSAPVPLSLQGDWGVVRGVAGEVVLRRAVNSGPIAVSRL